jgi:polyhydroxyalkanoate synthesis regulator phasin
MGPTKGGTQKVEIRRQVNGFPAKIAFPSLALLLAAWFLPPNCLGGSPARERQLGPGITREFSATMEDFLQALHEVLEDQTIHGTWVYDKQPVLTGATVVNSTPLFEPWNQPGQVFYKVLKDAIAPRHFLDTADQGTIAVRYIVTSLSPERVRLHIDATYVEKTHRTSHISDGTVEASEAKVIEDHLHAIQTAEQENLEAIRRRDSAELVRKTELRQREDEKALLTDAQSSVQTLQEQVKTLQHELTRRVKAPGTELKAAPFHSSAAIKTLAAYTEVIIVIVTPHWYGVELHEGQHGWIHLDNLEPLP